MLGKRNLHARSPAGDDVYFAREAGQGIGMEGHDQVESAQVEWREDGRPIYLSGNIYLTV